MADLGTPAANLNEALWEKGNFTRVAESMRHSGEALVDTLAVEPGMKVLDLGCGDGTTALPAAMRGADVLGVDVAANLVAAGNARAFGAGLTNLRFEEGDASRLTNLPDAAFDLVVGVFGAIRAATIGRGRGDGSGDQKRRPHFHGQLDPGDPTLVAQILKISSAYTPPPPEGFVSPMTWGDEAQVRERFGRVGIPAANIGFEQATWVFRVDAPPSELLAIFRDYYGPTMNAFDAASKDGRADELGAELEALFAAQNRGGERTEIPATFLKVTVTKP